MEKFGEGRASAQVGTKVGTQPPVSTGTPDNQP
jgi:hypothetical protein